jgi:hypothetical protein
LFFSLPSDLDVFIRFELRDRIRRQEERRQGNHDKRMAPVAQEYARYQLNQGKMEEPVYRRLVLEIAYRKSGDQA